MNKKLLLTLIITLLIGSIVFTYRMIFSEKNIDVTSTECFEFDEETETITKYKEICGTEVRIPSKLNGKEVKKIGNYVFANMGLTKLVLPETLEEIGIGAFQNNEIKELVIPDSVKAAKALSFFKNKIKKLKIGKNLTNIGIMAFNNNQVKGENEFIYMRDTNGISDTVIIGYAGAEKENVVIPKNIEMLYLSALEDCSIKSVTLNSKLERLETSSLANNELTKLVIPKNVIIVGMGAISGNEDLEEIVVEGKTKVEEFVLFDNSDMYRDIIKFIKR